jgi:hypothetical protein
VEEIDLAWNEEAHIRCLFSYACPQLWSRLDATATPNRRHCEECERDVHLVRNEEDFFQHVAQGHCVAVPVKVDTFSLPEPFVVGLPKMPG